MEKHPSGIKPESWLVSAGRAGMRRAGAGHLVLRTDSDWIADTVRFVVARKRRWSGGVA